MATDTCDYSGIVLPDFEPDIDAPECVKDMSPECLPSMDGECVSGLDDDCVSGIGNECELDGGDDDDQGDDDRGVDEGDARRNIAIGGILLLLGLAAVSKGTGNTR